MVWTLNCSIVPVFLSLFEVSFQNISPFSNGIKPKLFEMLSDATKSNAQRNKLSLQATTSSSISHFRKTHLKQHEVVMGLLMSYGHHIMSTLAKLTTLKRHFYDLSGSVYMSKDYQLKKLTMALGVFN